MKSFRPAGEAYFIVAEYLEGMHNSKVAKEEEISYMFNIMLLHTCESLPKYAQDCPHT